MNPATLIAGLLHDTVEDTESGLDTRKPGFGDQAAQLVDGLTKLAKIGFREAAQAENLRKMVVAMAKDPRVLVVKLADRLHNMRTMRYLRREQQEKKARETLEIYAPLAPRRGMNTTGGSSRTSPSRSSTPSGTKRSSRLCRARAQARRVPRHSDRRGPVRPARGPHQGHRHRPPEALLQRLPEDDRAGP